MIVDVSRHGVAAISFDDESAKVDGVRSVRASMPGRVGVDRQRSVRLLVEVLNRYGGHANRALVGGRLEGQSNGRLSLEVSADVGPTRTCKSRLWRQPFVVGMPEEFAHATLAGLRAGVGAPAPCGSLVVDRAGFDEMESSVAVFRLAAAILARALVSTLWGRDVESEVRTFWENSDDASNGDPGLGGSC